MQIKGIYVFLLLGFIQLAALFFASPYMTAQKIAEIIHTEDEAAWAKEIDQDYFKKYTRALLDGMLRIKMSADIQRGHTREALQDYTIPLPAKRWKSMLINWFQTRGYRVFYAVKF